MTGEELRAALDPLVDDGTLTVAQADAVSARVARPSRRGTVLVEAAGYIGAAIAAAALLLLLNELWGDLEAWARSAVLAVVAAALWAGGWWVRAPARDAVAQGPAARLAGVLWLLACASLAGAVGIAAADADLVPERAIGVLVGAVLTVAALPLWRARPAVLQSIALYSGVLAVAMGGLFAAGVEAPWSNGLLATAVGVAWALLAWGAWLPPARANLVLGALVAAVGPAWVAVDALTAGLVLGIAVGVALVAASLPLARPAVTAIGILAVTGYLLRMMSEVLPEGLGPTIGLLLVGLAVLAGALAALRVAAGTRGGADGTGAAASDGSSAVGPGDG